MQKNIPNKPEAPACCRPPADSGPQGQTNSSVQVRAESAKNRTESPKVWNARYFMAVALLAALWMLAYSGIAPLAHYLVFGLLGFAPDSHLGLSFEFFVYDSVKILLLLAALIYGIAWLRASLNVERARDFLAGKRRGLGYFLGAAFGAITPFCSCSSIPLFLGFTTARIPIGVTMSFLITSPLINEIAVVLLWGLLGWKFTLIYLLVGMAAGIAGGFVMDWLKAGRWLQPFILEALEQAPTHQYVNEAGEAQKLSVRQRHLFAFGEARSIFKRVWKWVIIGVGLGAALHGFVPDNWFAENLGAGEWWSVPLAVLAAIPLYSNVTGIIPVMESLLLKGLPLGTTMAFCMSAVAASLPEVMMLRQIMTIKLQAAFIGYLWVIFTLAGWLFNFLGPYLMY
ncbi:permease [Desulfovibrio sp. OttesenSCG-928-C14]|nr:permease [Desulfovibrio sp. OttesenSCG-928-C14]